MMLIIYTCFANYEIKDFCHHCFVYPLHYIILLQHIGGLA